MNDPTPLAAIASSGADDSRYFERRAEQELSLAQHAADPRAVKAHYELACRYLELIHGPSDNQPPAIST